KKTGRAAPATASPTLPPRAPHARPAPSIAPTPGPTERPEAAIRPLPPRPRGAPARAAGPSRMRWRCRGRARSRAGSGARFRNGHAARLMVARATTVLLEGQPHRPGEKLNERCGRSKGVDHRVHQLARSDVAIGERQAGGKVFALEILDEGMIGIVSRRGPLERFAHHAARGTKLATRGGTLPTLGVGNDAVADLFQGGRLRMPDAGAGHRGSRLDAQIKAGRGVILCLGMPEVRADVGFVGALVLREAGIPVDPKHRAADPPGIADAAWAYFLEPRSQCGDEVEHRIAHFALESLFVGLEPDPIIVRAQVGQEAKCIGIEVGHAQASNTGPGRSSDDQPPNHRGRSASSLTLASALRRSCALSAGSVLVSVGSTSRTLR